MAERSHARPRERRPTCRRRSSAYPTATSRRVTSTSVCRRVLISDSEAVSKKSSRASIRFVRVNVRTEGHVAVAFALDDRGELYPLHNSVLASCRALRPAEVRVDLGPRCGPILAAIGIRQRLACAALDLGYPGLLGIGVTRTVQARDQLDRDLRPSSSVRARASPSTLLGPTQVSAPGAPAVRRCQSLSRTSR